MRGIPVVGEGPPVDQLLAEMHDHLGRRAFPSCERTDERTHAHARESVDGDAGLGEHLEYADMREAVRRPPTARCRSSDP